MLRIEVMIAHQRYLPVVLRYRIVVSGLAEQIEQIQPSQIHSIYFYNPLRLLTLRRAVLESILSRY